MHRSNVIASALAVMFGRIAAQRNNGTFPALNTTSSSPPPPRTTMPPNTTASTNASISWQTTGIDASIPGLISVDCYAYEQNLNPCDAVCGSDDPRCISAASSAASSCSPQWDAYNAASASWAVTYFPPGSTTVPQIFAETYISLEFASYSTDTAVSFTEYQGLVYNPVYGFGTPSTYLSPYPPDTFMEAFPNTAPPTTVNFLSTYTTEGITTVTTDPQIVPQAYLFTEPTPYCSVTGVESIQCNQCTIGGGSVQLFYWPSTTMHGNLTGTPTTIATAVVSGVTMTSPSVYISLQTVLATNDCRAVGAAYGGSVLTMDPSAVSTVFAANGPGYGPGMAARMDFNDLTGAVPASVYELNNNCARFGCPTIANDLYKPTLAIPSEIRSLDPAWADCLIGLDGFYDPPSALTAQMTIAAPTLPPKGGAAPTPSNDASSPPAVSAAPSPSPVNPSPGPTSLALPDSDSPGAQPTASPPSPESPGTASGNAVHPGTLAPPPSQSISQEAANPQPGVSVSPIGLQPDPGAAPESDPNSPGLGPSPGQIDTTPTGAPADSPGAPVISPGAPVESPGLPVITVGSDTYTQQSVSGGFVIGTQTLNPGGVITVAGNTLSLPSSGSQIIIDGTTEVLAPGSGVGSASATAQSLEAGLVTENASGKIIVDGTTLGPGQAITIGSGSAQTTLNVLTSDSRTVVVFGTSSTMTFDSRITSTSPDPTATISTQKAVASPTSKKSNAANQSLCWRDLFLWLASGFVIYI